MALPRAGRGGVGGRGGVRGIVRRPVGGVRLAARDAIRGAEPRAERRAQPQRFARRDRVAVADRRRQRRGVQLDRGLHGGGGSDRVGAVGQDRGHALDEEGRRRRREAAALDRPVHQRRDRCRRVAGWRRVDGVRAQRRELVDHHPAVAPLRRRVEVDRQLGLDHPLEREQRPEPVAVQLDDAADAQAVGLDELARALLLPRDDGDRGGEPREVVDVGEVDEVGVVGERRGPTGERTAAQVERAVARAIGERPPVRVHDERRVAVGRVDELADAEQVRRQDAEAAQLEREARVLDPRREPRDVLAHRRDGVRAQAVGQHDRERVGGRRREPGASVASLRRVRSGSCTDTPRPTVRIRASRSSGATGPDGSTTTSTSAATIGSRSSARSSSSGR